jgi:AraC family transcriptional regulator, exoenzyme S synthesis regulatory protein ExsA
MLQESMIQLHWKIFSGSSKKGDNFHLEKLFSDVSFCEKEKYYCYTTTNILSFDASDRLKDNIQGEYLWIEIQSATPPTLFGVLMNVDWLQELLLVQPPSLYKSINQVLKRWQHHNTEVYSQFFIYKKNYQNRAYQELISRSYFYELLRSLIVEVEMELQVNQENFFKNKELNVIKQVVKQTLDTMHLPTPPIESMAASAGMSASKFKILFKEIYGVSPHQYIIDKKLAYAHQLFKSGQYTLTQIAYKIGYNHTSGFTRIYKKKYHENSNTIFSD